MECPLCNTAIPKKDLQDIGHKVGFPTILIAVVTTDKAGGKHFRLAEDSDLKAYQRAGDAIKVAQQHSALPVRPDEALLYLRSIFNCHVYGMTTWGALFNDRQALTLWRFAQGVSEARMHIEERADINDTGSSCAVATYLAFVLDRVADFCSTLTRWHPQWIFVPNTFGRQALPMTWDHAELNPLSPILSGTWESMLRQVDRSIEACVIGTDGAASVVQGSATRVPLGDNSVHAVITDPPYYDAVPYADLSDFFYVWLKRTVGDLYPAVLRTPLTPKTEEAVQLAERNTMYASKTKEFFESQMGLSFAQAARVCVDGGVIGVMFAHKTTSAWETLILGLTSARLCVTASWPMRTEMKARQRAQNSAALASSVLLVCRPLPTSATEGYWDDVRNELRQVVRERLDFFWQQGIRGADFFISAIGPALSVYGRYAKVTRLTGEEVSVGQFLDEVRGIVTDYALSQILHGAKTGHGTSAVLQVDSETRFYVLWKWSYGDAKVPADEAFKLAQALGIDTEEMWDRTGVLEKQGQNVQALTVAKRTRINDLGEPNVDGSPATLIDTLHRCCAFRDKGDLPVRGTQTGTGGLSEYLARSGHGRNEKLWTVAQAISEVLPDGDREKQLLQGLLNQRDKVVQDLLPYKS